jgi:hypothetical protein
MLVFYTASMYPCSMASMHLGLLRMLSGSPQSKYIGVKFSSSSINPPHTCGLMRIWLHANKGLRDYCVLLVSTLTKKMHDEVFIHCKFTGTQYASLFLLILWCYNWKLEVKTCDPGPSCSPVLSTDAIDYLSRRKYIDSKLLIYTFLA